MTVAGPLTTTFTAPSSCSTEGAQIYQVWSESSSSYVAGPLFTRGSDCFPSGYDPTPTNYYSPGWCPQGYTTACSSLATTSSKTETAVICCPTHHDFSCPANGSIDAPALGCTSTWTNALGMLAVTVVRDGEIQATPTLVSETAGGITAYGIQVRFQSGDPTPSPTPTAPSSFPSISAPTYPFIPTPTASPVTSTGISTPVAIGIGIGSAAAALLIAGTIGLFFFLRWRRKKRHFGSNDPPPSSPSSSPRVASSPPVPPKELPGSPVPYHRTSVVPPFELSDESVPRRSPTPSKRYMTSSPVPGWTASPSGRKDGQILVGGTPVVVGEEHEPAELEASEPSPSLRERMCASPAFSESSVWSARGGGGGRGTPNPWL